MTAERLTEAERAALIDAWERGAYAGREYQKRLYEYAHVTSIAAAPPQVPPNPYRVAEHADRLAAVQAERDALRERVEALAERYDRHDRPRSVHRFSVATDLRAALDADREEVEAVSEHRHHGHEPGEWRYYCCACSDLFDPGCPACAEAVKGL